MGTNPQVYADVLARWPSCLRKPMDRVTPFIRSGTTSVPLPASWASQAGGMSHAPAVAMMASNGPWPGAPSSPSPVTTVTRPP